MVKPAQRETVLTKRLKEARLRAGLTQMQLGVLAGIEEESASARVNQYERGVHAPDYGTVQRLATALMVPTSFLFEDDDALASVILKFGELKQAQRKQLLKLIEDL
jgi:transcriptional regulator with XRE-family HTH domain